MGDSHHFHHHHHQPRPKSQVFCDDDDDDIDFPERSSSSTGLIRHSETHHSVQSQNQKSELEQLRSRVCQMEKTMRWWSDCTTNWKQKWSQVRQERNALRAQLKEITGGSVAPKPEMKTTAIQTDHCGDQMRQTNNNTQNMSTAADVHLLTKLLDEAQRTIAIEREEKLHLHRSIERLQQDLVEFHTMYDELVKEVQLLKLDENSKVSEDVDQQDVGEDVAADHAQHDEDNSEECVELVETGVDGDDDEEDNAHDAEVEHDEDGRHCHQGGSFNDGGDGSNRILVMTNSKSQQINGKSGITNDADHHTSL